jgi:hypothetical protein
VTGVDLGCGVACVQTDLSLNDLEGKLPAIRARLEDQIPVGEPDVKGSWAEPRVERVWDAEFDDSFARLTAQHPPLEGRQHPSLQLGSCTMSSRTPRSTLADVAFARKAEVGQAEEPHDYR